MKKKVCPRCYFINDKTDSYCGHCGEIIEHIEEENLSYEECQEHNYYRDGKFFDESPVKPAEPEIKEEIKEEPEAKMVKVCPDCGAKCSPTERICPKCHHFLAGVEAVSDEEKEAKTPIVEEAKPAIKEKELDYFNPDGYAFYFGNMVLDKIDFRGGVKCYIGRIHQTALMAPNEELRYISKNHCYVRMDSRGTVLVGEDESRPSRNGTAVYKSRERTYYLVKPGPQGEIAVESGDEIILACNSIRHQFRIIVVKR